MKQTILGRSLLAALAASLCGTAAAQTWSDDFESYAAGSALETQGGWTGWDGVTTAFTVVTTTQAHSGTQSIQPNPGADTVYQFTPPTQGTWVFEGWLYVPSTFASNLDFMVMNDYNHGGPYEWGSWLSIDGGTGMVTCNCGGSAAATTPIAYDEWVEIKEIIDLTNNTAEIYFDGVLFASYIWTDGWSGNTGHAVGSIDAVDIYATGAGGGAFLDDIRLYEIVTPIGTNYCSANMNASGGVGSISATGLLSAASNDVTLTASNLPTNAFGFFITSLTQGFVANPSGSYGNLCLGGSIGRYVGAGQIQNTGAGSEFSLTLDLTQTPQPMGFVSVMAGETWNYQSWFRDNMGGVPGSNFTDGLTVQYL